MTDNVPTTEESSQDDNPIHIPLLNSPNIYNPHNQNLNNYIQRVGRLNIADNYTSYQQNNISSQNRPSSSSYEIGIKSIYYDDRPIDFYENEEEQIYDETTLLLKLLVDRNNIEKKVYFLERTDTNDQLNAENIGLFINGKKKKKQNFKNFCSQM